MNNVDSNLMSSTTRPQTSTALTIGIVVITIPAILLLAALVLAVVVAVYTIYQRKKKSRINIADPEYGFVISNQAAESSNKQNEHLLNSASCPDNLTATTGAQKPIHLKPGTGMPLMKSYPQLAVESRRGTGAVEPAVAMTGEPRMEEVAERVGKEFESTSQRPRKHRGTIGPFRIGHKTMFELRFMKNGRPFFYKRSARVTPQEMTEPILPAGNRGKRQTLGGKPQDYKYPSNRSKPQGFGPPLPVFVNAVPWTDDCLEPQVVKKSKRGAKHSIPVISGINYRCGPPIEDKPPSKYKTVRTQPSVTRRSSIKSHAPSRRGVRGLLKRRPSTKSQAPKKIEEPVASESKKLLLMGSFKLREKELSDHTKRLVQQESDLSRPDKVIPKDLSMITHGPLSIGRASTILDQNRSGIEVLVPEMPGVPSKSTQLSAIVPSVGSTDYSAQLYGHRAGSDATSEGLGESSQVKLPTIDPSNRYTEVQLEETKEFGDMHFSGLSSLDEGEESNYKLSDILGGSAESNAESQLVELKESDSEKLLKGKLSPIVEDAEETSFMTQQADHSDAAGTVAAAIIGQNDPSTVRDTLMNLSINRAVEQVGLSGIHAPLGHTEDAIARDHTPGPVNVAKISNMIKNLVPSTDSENDSIDTRSSLRAENRLSRDGREIQMGNIQEGLVKGKKYARKMDAGALLSKMGSMDDSEDSSLARGQRNTGGWGVGAKRGIEAEETDQESQLQSVTEYSQSNLGSQVGDQESLLGFGQSGFKHSKRKMKRLPTRLSKDGSMQTCYRGDAEGNWNTQRQNEVGAEILSLTDQTSITESQSARDYSTDQGNEISESIAYEKSADQLSINTTSFNLLPPRSKSRRFKKRARNVEPDDNENIFPSISADGRDLLDDQGTVAKGKRHQIGSLFEEMEDSTSTPGKKDKKGSLFAGQGDSIFSFSVNDHSTNLEHYRSMDQVSQSTSFNLRPPSSKSRRYVRMSGKNSPTKEMDAQDTAHESGSDIPTLSTREIHKHRVEMDLSGRPVKTGGKMRAPAILKPLRTTTNDSDLLLSEKQQKFNKDGKADGGARTLKSIKEIGSEDISSHESSAKKAAKKVIFETNTDTTDKNIPLLDMMGGTAQNTAVGLSGADFEHTMGEVEFGKRTGLAALMVVEDAIRYGDNELNTRDSQILRSETENDEEINDEEISDEEI